MMKAAKRQNRKQRKRRAARYVAGQAFRSNLLAVPLTYKALVHDIQDTHAVVAVVAADSEAMVREAVAAVAQALSYGQKHSKAHRFDTVRDRMARGNGANNDRSGLHLFKANSDFLRIPAPPPATASQNSKVLPRGVGE